MNSTISELVSTDLDEDKLRQLDPFIKCTKDVFSMMVGWTVDLVDVISNDKHAARHDCSGIIGFSGSARGSIVVSLDQDVALNAAAAFLGERPNAINAEVIDTVGEITNMIGGSSKDRLGVAGIAIGFPMVVTGRDHFISFDPRAQVEMLRFTSPHGPFTVEIAIVDAASLLASVS